MSFVPSFEIGVWNAWIFMAAWLFFHMAPLDWLIFRYDIKGMFRKGAASPSYNKSEKIINNLGMVTWFILVIYSVFLPLPIGTPLFYTGLALFLLGLVIFEIAGIPWATTPLDEPITSGLYRYSRHPIYIAVFLQFIGIGIASASGLFLLLVVIHIILSIPLIPPEERFCCERYGEAYRDYMNRTPRWIGVPKEG
jgi:protein-S-isoprenylcysteine O-methyltransferase Ste14